MVDEFEGLIIMMRWCVETINTCSQTFFPYYNGFRYYIWVFWTLFFTSFYFSFTLTKTKRKNGRQIDYFDVTVCNLYQFVIILSLVVEKNMWRWIETKIVIYLWIKVWKKMKIYSQNIYRSLFLTSLIFHVYWVYWEKAQRHFFS